MKIWIILAIIVFLLAFILPMYWWVSEKKRYNNQCKEDREQVMRSKEMGDLFGKW